MSKKDEIKQQVKGAIRKKITDAFNYAVVHRPVLTGAPEIVVGAVGLGALVMGGAAPIVAVPAAVAGVALLIHGAARNGLDRVDRIDKMIEYDQRRFDEKQAKLAAKKARHRRPE